VGQGVREPRKIVDATPVYPTLALSVKVEGAVILEAVINERGVVERLKVLKSVPLLDAAAIDAVSRWRYTPTLLNGTPVSVLMTITINFTLK
jgi:protein TonB